MGFNPNLQVWNSSIPRHLLLWHLNYSPTLSSQMTEITRSLCYKQFTIVVYYSYRGLTQICQYFDSIVVIYDRRNLKNNIGHWIVFLFGGHHSSADLSAPTIVRPRVQFPSTTSMLFQFIFEMRLEKNKDAHDILKLIPDLLFIL